jgi:hypothetical protein
VPFITSLQHTGHDAVIKNLAGLLSADDSVKSKTVKKDRAKAKASIQKMAAGVQKRANAHKKKTGVAFSEESSEEGEEEGGEAGSNDAEDGITAAPKP